MSRNGNGGPPNSTGGPNNNTGGGRRKKPKKKQKPKGKGQGNKPNKERKKYVYIKELEEYCITKENKATMFAEFKEALARHAGSKGQAEWQRAIRRDRQIGRADFVTATLNRPRPADVDNPTWEEE